MRPLIWSLPLLSAFMHAPHVIRDRTIYAMTPASVAVDVPAVFSAKALGAANVTDVAFDTPGVPHAWCAREGY